MNQIKLLQLMSIFHKCKIFADDNQKKSDSWRFLMHKKRKKSKLGPEIPALFDDVSNLDRIFMALQFYFNVTLSPRKSVIVPDEIQECPKALELMKEEI